MTPVDYTKPIELVHTDGRVLPATVDEAWSGAGVPSVWPEASLFAVSVNMLARAGWKPRNV